MISVVIPVLNEEESIENLNLEIFEIKKKVPIDEVIYIDDGSTDSTIKKLIELKKNFHEIKILKHKINKGQSAAFLTGILNSKNELIITLDGDGQNPPFEIINIWTKYEDEKKNNFSFAVIGQRTNRKDSIIKKMSSKIANKIRSFVLSDNIKDTGCSLKLFKKKDYLNLPYFNHMHRFIPFLMMRDNIRVITIDVSHRKRIYGKSKYDIIKRTVNGCIDLLGVLWLKLRKKKASDEEIIKF